LIFLFLNIVFVEGEAGSKSSRTTMGMFCHARKKPVKLKKRGIRPLGLEVVSPLLLVSKKNPISGECLNI